LFKVMTSCRRATSVSGVPNFLVWGLLHNSSRAGHLASCDSFVISHNLPNRQNFQK